MGEIVNFLPSCNYYFQRGMGFFSKGQYQRAAQCLERAQSLAKNTEEYVLANCQLAVCWQYAHQYQIAIQRLQMLVPTHAQHHPELYYFLANCYAYSGEFQASWQHVQRYLQSGQAMFKQEAAALQNELQTVLSDF